MFTKQHYEQIAQIIKQNLPPEGATTNNSIQSRSTLTCIAEDLADFFSEDNPRFKSLKFLEACGTHK